MIRTSARPSLKACARTGALGQSRRRSAARVGWPALFVLSADRRTPAKGTVDQNLRRAERLAAVLPFNWCDFLTEILTDDDIA
ncbi:hypothetical protein AJ88_23480 [Mesorhizobium amorphae CCBAU 01583]|nr:hypothetical protein AJ88_23480 [Mesorhizobium amorphae CCBAU 01583]